MKILIAVLALLLLILQYQAWFGRSGHRTQAALQEQLQEQQRRIELHEQRNRRLRGEVLAMQRGNAAIESLARTNLGMIKEGEVFYVLTDNPQ